MKTHSIVSSKCKVEKNKLREWAVFASGNIKKGELIALWGGVIYSAKDVKNLSKKYPHFATHTVSVFKGYYLGPVNTDDKFDDAEFFNHSCDPNIGIKGQIILVARRDIKKNEELCFDYDTTESTSIGSFKCNCGTKYCRKLINGTAWKDKVFVKRNKGYLSWYIEELIKEDGKK